jgi:hypothetical protein
MSLDPTLMLLSLIPGGIGFVMFVYGKKQQRWPILGFGLAFIVYPYFTESVAMMVGVGVVLGVLFWMALRMGW